MARDARIEAIRKKYDRERASLLVDQQNLGVRPALTASALEKEADELSHRLNDLIADNQVYRFAAMIYGYDDPAQMTAKELNTFCFIWFGLVAFAVSVLGPFLALCYYRIKYQDTRGRDAWHALLKAARRLLIRLARRNKIVKIEERVIEKVMETPVEVEVLRDVVREIPVDNVVIREVEVIREVPVDRVVVQEVIREVPVDRIVPYMRSRWRWKRRRSSMSQSTPTIRTS